MAERGRLRRRGLPRFGAALLLAIAMGCGTSGKKAIPDAGPIQDAALSDVAADKASDVGEDRPPRDADTTGDVAPVDLVPPDAVRDAPSLDGATSDTASDAGIADAGDVASTDASRPDGPVPCSSTGLLPGPIVYARATSGGQDATIFRLSADGLKEDKWVQGNFPRVSPSGRFLLYHQGTGGTSLGGQVWIRDLTGVPVADGGSADMIIFSGGDYTVAYGFTPDESRVVFDYSCSIQIVNRDGTGLRTFFNFTDCFSDAPSVRATDGMVVLHNDHVGLATAKPDGSGAAMLANTAPGDHWPVFSPDGQWIAFMRSPGAASAETKLYRIALDGTGLTMVGSLQNAASGAIVSTDGRRFVAYGSRDGEAALYAFDFLGTSEPVRVCIPAGGDVTFVGGAAE